MPRINETVKGKPAVYAAYGIEYKAEKDPMFPELVKIINNKPSMVGGF